MRQKKVKAILQCIRSSILKISYYKLVLENSMTTKICTYGAGKEGVSYKVYGITTVNLCYTIHKFRPHIMVATSVYCALHARTIANKSN